MPPPHAQGRPCRSGADPLLPAPPLADDLVCLRPFREEDVPHVTRACRDPQVQRYTRVPSPYCEDDARAFILGASGRRLAGESIDLAVAAHEGDRLLGAIGLVIDRHDIDRAEVGYWVVPAERGRGIAGRALSLMATWAVTDGRFARIDLQAAISNVASIRVAERCGFVREATMRSAWYRGIGRSDMALFSLLPSDLGLEPEEAR